MDILDLDIKYKVAYFQSKLKDVESKGSGEGFSKEDTSGASVEKREPSTFNPFQDQFLHQSLAGFGTGLQVMFIYNH